MIENFDEIVSLRHHLHQHPEVSNNEKNTAIVVKNFIQKYNPDQIIEEIGGNGILFVFEGLSNGPTVAIRAELDALPIGEINDDLTYRSVHDGVGHKCGHDGHMSMVAGLAAWLNKNKPTKGRVVLLFQPAEETGEGALSMLKDPKFQDFQLDYIFALHNLPGYPKHQIIIKNGVFNAASQGLIINLKGKTAHAAEPENGISPGRTMGAIMEMLEDLIDELDLNGFGLVTIVHASLGEPAFGVSPDKAVLMVTLRANYDRDLEEIENAIRSFVKLEAETNQLKWSIEEREGFQSSVNDSESVDLINESATHLELDIFEKEDPLRWSEDFGLFTQKYKGAMFGLGSGKHTPDLHNPDYDFPDDILITGISMYQNLINMILNK